MSEEPSKDDKTEEATPERREDFREKGQIAVSREISSTFTLMGVVAFFTFAIPTFLANLESMFIKHFESISFLRMNNENVLDYALDTWMEVLYIILPLFLVTVTIAILTTFAQTRMNWSWKKMKPDFSKMNPLTGLKRMVSLQAVVELTKGICKMTAVGMIGYLILSSEWSRMPGLMQMAIGSTWTYWGEITKNLFWAVSFFLFVIAMGDFAYNFSELEKKMKMTKQEVKDEFKKRESDPQQKARMRRMQREFATRKAIDLTREATVLVTNPTHYSIALKYEPGMDAPVVLAKGIDFLALKMREAAKDSDVPLVENRPLARELYATVEEGQAIPDKLFKVVAEIIRYVFKLKGKTPGVDVPVN